VGDVGLAIHAHIGYQPLVPWGILAGDNQARANVRVPVQQAHDLVGFDPITTDFDLVVDPPQKSELTVW